MSKTMREIEDMTAVRADFDSFLSVGDFDNARHAIDIMGESYSEFEALKMFQEYNRKLTGGSYEDGIVSDREALAEEVY